MSVPTLNYESLLRKNHGTAVDGDKVLKLACILCETEVADPRLNRCPECKGAIDAIYDLGQVRLDAEVTPDVLRRYFPLLPLRDKGRGGWLGEGNTPCFQVPALAEKLGMGQLWFKDESANPTYSTKDRIASVGLARFAELGVRDLVLSSTGNSSTAYARGVQLRPGFKLNIFVGRDFVNRLNYEDHPAIATHVVDGAFVAAGKVGMQYAKDNGYFWEGGFFNYARREGLKLAYLEAFDAMTEQPDFVFQAISSGMGLMGAFKGAIEYRELGRIDRLPAFMAVQQESCAPMAHAFGEDADAIAEHHIIREPSGLAYAILRGDPTGTYPYIRGLCQQSGGRILAAAETGIHEARALLDSVGLRPCFASATSFAGAIKAAREGVLGKDSVVLVNLTGADRPAVQIPQAYSTWTADAA